jgi:hypothetical protein
MGVLSQEDTSMLAHYDAEKRELCIRLSNHEEEKRFHFLAEWLPQFLDRELRELGDTIGKAMEAAAVSACPCRDGD